jgi:hypothetical protein
VSEIFHGWTGHNGFRNTGPAQDAVARRAGRECRRRKRLWQTDRPLPFTQRCRGSARPRPDWWKT